MSRWELLDSAEIPDGRELRFYQRRDEFSIRVPGFGELMNSRTHGSEDTLARLTCAGRSDPVVLIGGLGMGFTLAAALECTGPDAVVEVSELVPEVVEWNRGPLGEVAGRPLDDSRVTVLVEDIADTLTRASDRYDGVALDVDNGPEGFVRNANDWLYSMEGLAAAHAALKPGGTLTVWSAGPDRAFTTRLESMGFDVEEHRVRAHGKKGARHLIWRAVRPVD